MDARVLTALHLARALVVDFGALMVAHGLLPENGVYRPLSLAALPAQKPPILKSRKRKRGTQIQVLVDMLLA
jgi:hypothetical protein